MKRTFAIAGIAELCILALLLHNYIKDFLFIHPWWQGFIAALPAIAVPILAWFELQHSREANHLRIEANDLRNDANTHRIRANGLQEDLNKSVAQIAGLQGKIADLTRELDTERNKHLQQIAANTQRPLSEAEINAGILRKHIGERAAVSESHGNWGGGAIIAELNANNIATLFVPASFNNSQAYAQAVRCDKLHIVETPKDGCAVQITIIERYGTHTPYGEARSWDERNVQPTNAGIKRGANVFHAQYRKDGSPTMRNIYIYASTDGSPEYTMAAMEGQQETNSWHSGKAGIEKKFAIVQLEWIDQGYRWIGGSDSGSSLNLFIRK